MTQIRKSASAQQVSGGDAFNYIYLDAKKVDPDTGLEMKDDPNIFQVRTLVDF